MKLKTTTLAALLALGAGHAAAQSNVRIYGILDVGMAWGKGSVASSTQLAGGNLVPPRLGFAGSEDLGGGLKAAFALEAGLNRDNGTGLQPGRVRARGPARGSAGARRRGGLTFSA